MQPLSPPARVIVAFTLAATVLLRGWQPLEVYVAVLLEKLSSNHIFLNLMEALVPLVVAVIATRLAQQSFPQTAEGSWAHQLGQAAFALGIIGIVVGLIGVLSALVSSTYGPYFAS
ncbi:MAG: hypothetical protein JWR35_621 [Marmoricola sp.]|jgi:hypothetical protein|nr:hypothetical protein [Marmoricola sp.]